MFNPVGTLGGRSVAVVEDAALDQRIRTAYRLAMKDEPIGEGSLWSVIHRMNMDVHDALMNADEGPLALRDPASSSLAHGFDNLTADISASLADDGIAALWLSRFEDDLRSLAQALGVKRIENPEGGGGYVHNEARSSRTVDEIVERIAALFGSTLLFPTPFPNELGLFVAGGLASQRTMPAIYQAWRLKQALAQYGGDRVVEIGAGYGRTAFYAVTAGGIRDYAIVDLPLTNAAQASFLGRSLGPDRICLFGETHRPGQIRIMPVKWFRTNLPQCDVALNVDSLTEMPRQDATAYAEWAMNSAKVLLSINHEANEFTVRELTPLKARCVGRFPSTLRPGYAEELFLPAGTSPARASLKRWLRRLVG